MCNGQSQTNLVNKRFDLTHYQMKITTYQEYKSDFDG